MKQTLMILIIFLLTNHSVAADNNANEMSLKTSVLFFGLNFRAANVEVLTKMLTADYVHINGGSGNVIDRDAWLNWVKSQRKELDQGNMVIEEYEIKDYRQRIYGATAFVTGVVESSGRKAGESFASKIRFSNVWVKQKGRWLRAAFHDSPIK